MHELIVCSLEAWDDVWRRNQFFTDLLLRRNPTLRVLFVEPPADPLYDISRRALPALPRWRRPHADGRLVAFRPLKPLPRRVWSAGDEFLRRQVLLGARLLRMNAPVLWLNDVTYAPLITRTRWPSVYDVTDDWLLDPSAERGVERLRRLDIDALQRADEVVVCSPELAKSRGERRSVTLIRNAVDVAHFASPRARPPDLPAGAVAVYVGTLHESRLDVGLVEELARSLPEVSVVLVGPDALETRSRRLLSGIPNVALLGARAYRDVPAYLQHADVIVVPHVVSPFTDSLDPIKAYECLAVRTPTVATPVAGFRELSAAIEIVDRASFVPKVSAILGGAGRQPTPLEPPTWEERGAEFEAVLRRAEARNPRTSGAVPANK